MEAQAVKDGLEPGDKLNWYRIDRVLGRGGFGITYLATDTNLKTRVAIKEYLPAEVATRGPDSSLKPTSSETKHLYQWGLDRFIAEAQTLARFSHPNIVRVLSVFESNGTAYMVMEYQQGTDLRVYLKKQPLVTETLLKRLFRPIIDGLELVHQRGFIHRDIKPSNIMVSDSGSPVLIDFGSARRSYDTQTSTLTSLVSVGYTPLEQYNDSADDKQGPWTDIYACGAVLHYAITGKPPPDATQRGSALLNRSADPLKPLSEVAAGRYSMPFLHAIDWALGFAIAERPKTLATWSARLFADEVPNQISMPEPVQSMAPKTPENEAYNADAVTASKVATSEVAVSRDATANAATVTMLDSFRHTQTASQPVTNTDDWDMSFLGNGNTAPPDAAQHVSNKRRSPGLISVLLLLALAAGGYWYYQGYNLPGGQNNQPLSDQFPMEAANRQIEKLATAFRETDLGAVSELSTLSAQSLSLLTILFRQFESMDIELSALEPQSDNQAKAFIKLTRMIRSGGSVAYPSKSFENLAVEVTQKESGAVALGL